MKHILFASIAALAPVAFMSEICETVMAKVKGGSNDYVRVNKSDVDANPDNYTVSDKQTENQDPPAPAGIVTNVAPGLEIPPAPSAPVSVLGDKVVAPTVPAPDQKLVKQDGKKFYVVRPDGTRIEDVEGIDATGYKTEADAWKAVMALPH